VEHCNRVLADNRQNTAALGNLVRAELKLGDVKKGLELAIQTYNLDKTNPLSIANMALAYHYNNMPKERDEMFEALKNGAYKIITRLTCSLPYSTVNWNGENRFQRRIDLMLIIPGIVYQFSLFRG